jgi:hypothetical protein
MKDRKDFDCVQMKCEIQQRLLDEFQDMSREEARQSQQHRIAADPVLGSFLQKVAMCCPDAAHSHS